jgi:site-specific DNA-cytosine methylase
LARNFDSTLYPDIAKLTAKPSPIDVYGQQTPLPPFNMFVAGTSCKNFSMLRTKYRIDIEDKGCSGETFLAACEVLFEEQPPIAIFENVMNAPW